MEERNPGVRQRKRKIGESLKRWWLDAPDEVVEDFLKRKSEQIKKRWAEMPEEEREARRERQRQNRLRYWQTLPVDKEYEVRVKQSEGVKKAHKRKGTKYQTPEHKEFLRNLHKLSPRYIAKKLREAAPAEPEETPKKRRGRPKKSQE